ncbi:hypothetical protein Q3O98_21085 [Ralstonia pseudosolanacearum]|nr:hypothetical protein [Ralstonia pseudosolanacearum]QWQ11122.1 hypothetical protein KN198_12505 [Ralstonia solanacearum]MDC6292949.1 hypothetical protein [Ralstonia pseudosolanacearum]MDD7788186.1 hypothetical protein [Ralstonia pseudosolanacearum]MDO3543131.1 hypothetical protein [Ralstonia pseudosolanacearum]MDO3623575.1 hypothetical protein [Ralstonia pseudosolanacearum]
MTKRTLPVVPASAGSWPAGVEQDLCNRIHGLQSVSPQPSMHPVNPFLV